MSEASGTEEQKIPRRTVFKGSLAALGTLLAGCVGIPEVSADSDRACLYPEEHISGCAVGGGIEDLRLGKTERLIHDAEDIGADSRSVMLASVETVRKLDAGGRINVYKLGSPDSQPTTQAFYGVDPHIYKLFLPPATEPDAESINFHEMFHVYDYENLKSEDYRNPNVQADFDSRARYYTALYTHELKKGQTDISPTNPAQLDTGRCDRDAIALYLEKKDLGPDKSRLFYFFEQTHRLNTDVAMIPQLRQAVKLYTDALSSPTDLRVKTAYEEEIRDSERFLREIDGRISVYHKRWDAFLWQGTEADVRQDILTDSTYVGPSYLQNTKEKAQTNRLIQMAQALSASVRSVTPLATLEDGLRGYLRDRRGEFRIVGRSSNSV